MKFSQREVRLKDQAYSREYFLKRRIFSAPRKKRERRCFKRRFINRVLTSFSQDGGLRERHFVKGYPGASAEHQLHEFSEYIRDEFTVSCGSCERLRAGTEIPHNIQQFPPLYQLRRLRQHPERGM